MNRVEIVRNYNIFVKLYQEACTNKMSLLGKKTTKANLERYQKEVINKVFN